MDDKTSFSIAHRLATIRGSSRIKVLNGGVIEERRHTTTYGGKGCHYALYMSQFKGKGPSDGAVHTAGFVSTSSDSDVRGSDPVP